jgi:1-acyl-sn-glycerol-3-phosphate acyltransferase
MRSKSALFLGRRYLRWSAGRRLDGVWVRGLESASAALGQGPVLFAANHVSWWDGPLAVLADDRTGADSRFLVDAANLAKLPFLRWFGAVDLDRSSPLAARHGLNTTVKWLDAPGRSVWIFPQGRQRPAHRRPLDLSRGVEWLARRSGATTIPVGIQYGWRDDSRPTAVLSLGTPGHYDLSELTYQITQEIEAADAWLDGVHGGFAPLFPPPRHHINGGVGTRLLTAAAWRRP